jgi:malonyl-CoA O-methyltransferase
MKLDWQENDWFVHQRLVAQMDERLSILKDAPQDITIIGADFDLSHHALQQRYPQAQLTELDERPEYLELSAAERAKKRSMWKKLMGKKTQQVQGSLLKIGNTASADLLWSNLAFVHHYEPTALFDHWSEVLRKDGLLYFTHFGPDTLREIVRLLQSHGIAISDKRFIDMHDLGDMLFHHGFYDPVMDVDRLQLSYQNPQRFWRDMEILQVWQALQISDEQQETAQSIVNQAIQSGDLSGVTLEIVFGHAVKKLLLPENESLISFYPSKPQ